MKPHEPSHILVSRCDRLGDLVLSLPALGHLRKVQPVGAELFLHCSSYAEAVGEWALENELCSGIWAEGDALPKKWQQLNAENSWGLSLFHCPQAPRAFKNANIQNTLGPRTKLSALWSYKNSISQRRSRVEKSEMAYNVDLANALLQKMGLQEPPFEGLPPLKIPQNWRSLCGGADLLIVASNGGSAHNWPMERYLDLARREMAEGKSIQFLIHGTDAEERKREYEKSDLRDRAECLPSFDSLQSLIAHIASCGETFSSSTGPLHIAHAAGRPVTGLYPKAPLVQSFKRWRPDGYWHSAPVKWISL